MWPNANEQSDEPGVLKPGAAPSAELVSYYVREGERLRAAAVLDMFRGLRWAIGRAFRRPRSGTPDRLLGANS
jgi:hypothetical protein